MSPDFITAAEQEIAARLAAWPGLQGAEISTDEDGDLVAKIEAALAKLGLSIAVSVLGGPVPVPGDSQPWRFVVAITETPILHRDEQGLRPRGRTVLAEVCLALADRVLAITERVTRTQAEDGTVYTIEGTVQVALQTVTTT